MNGSKAALISHAFVCPLSASLASYVQYQQNAKPLPQSTAHIIRKAQRVSESASQPAIPNRPRCVCAQISLTAGKQLRFPSALNTEAPDGVDFQQGRKMKCGAGLHGMKLKRKRARIEGHRMPSRVDYTWMATGVSGVFLRATETRIQV